MLSQLHGTRYTIMAIVMAMGLLFAAPRSSHALSMMFEITVEQAPGVTAGTLTGQFTGENNNPANDVISIDELTDIQAEWTPDPGVPTAPAFFALGINDIIMFSYAITPPPAITALALTDLGDLAVLCGTDAPTFTPCTVGQSLFVFNTDTSATYTIAGVSIEPVQTTVIPEPSTWLLLGTGLVGVMGYAFSRRVRPVTTRRAPVAGA